MPSFVLQASEVEMMDGESILKSTLYSLGLSPGTWGHRGLGDAAWEVPQHLDEVYFALQ